MVKKDLLFLLEDFNDDMEVCYWSNGAPIRINQVKERKISGKQSIILLK